jgi:hypothetical protein
MGSGYGKTHLSRRRFALARLSLGNLATPSVGSPTGCDNQFCELWRFGFGLPAFVWQAGFLSVGHAISYSVAPIPPFGEIPP